MFNALNRFISRLDGEHPQQRQPERGSFGFQVLRNTNLDLAIEPWFDFIVGINGRPIVRASVWLHVLGDIANFLDRITLSLASSHKKYETVQVAPLPWGYGTRR